MSEHEVYVRAVHADGDAPGHDLPGLEVICTCGKVLLESDEGEISYGQVSNAYWQHCPVIFQPGEQVYHGSCDKPDCGPCNMFKREWNYRV